MEVDRHCCIKERAGGIRSPALFLFSDAILKMKKSLQDLILSHKSTLMPLDIAQKLKIREHSILLTINAPADFKKNLLPLPRGVQISSNAKTFSQIHLFIKDQQQMEKELKKVLPLIKDDVVCWIYYPRHRLVWRRRICIRL